MTPAATPEALEQTLQHICEAVEAEWKMSGLASDGDLYSDYAKEVARRAAAPILADLQQVTAERDRYRDGEEISDVMAQVGFDRMMEVCKERDTATAEAASLRAEVEAVLDEFEPRILRERLLPSESIASRVRHIAFEAVDGRAGEAGLLKTVERYEAANLALRADVEAKDRARDDALKAAIRAWSAKLHIPVTRMMSRELRAEFSAALARAAIQENTNE